MYFSFSKPKLTSLSFPFTRYFATLHPLSSANIWIRSNYNVVLLLGWLFGALIATFCSMDVVVGEKVHLDPATGSSFTYLDCMHWDTREVWENQLYVTSLFVLTFLLPMAFLTVSYGAIGRRLLHAQRHWCRFKHTGNGTVGLGGGGAGSGGGTAPYSVPTRSASNSNGGGKSPSDVANNKNEKAAAPKQSVKSKVNGFLRSKPSRQSIKLPRGSTFVSRPRSSGDGSSVSSVGANGHSNNGQNGQNGQRNNNCKSVRMYASQEEANNTNNGAGDENNSKVLICFDRRNTELHNKMRVSNGDFFGNDSHSGMSHSLARGSAALD